MRNITALAPAPNSALLAVVAKALAMTRGGEGGGHAQDALRYAEATGAPVVAQNYLKALVSAGATGDADLAGLADTRTIVTAFISSLRNRSLFYSLLDDGLVKVPLRTRISSVTADATAFLVGQGAAVPVSRMEIAEADLEPVRAAGLIVMTDEMLRTAGPAGEAMITRELRRVVTASVDDQFLALVVDGSTPTSVSAGNDASAAAADLRTLFQAVGITGESRAILALAPDVALAASTLIEGGSFVFPDMSPTGGRMINTDALVSDQLAAGTIMLLDGSGIAGNSDTITISASHDTSIEMRDDPVSSSTTPTGTTMVSMFQTFSTAMLAQAYFGAERIRDNAVATVTGVAWGEA